MIQRWLNQSFRLLVTSLIVLGWIYSLPAQALACDDLTSACGIFRTAYAHRYTWEEPFPGYQAEVSFMVETEQYHGRVKVRPDLTIDIINIEDEDLRQLVEAQLANEVIHRRRIPFEVAHETSQFEFMDLAQDTDLIAIQDLNSSDQAYYLIAEGNKLAQVNRALPSGETVSVTTLAWQETTQGVLPTWYQVEFRDASGTVVEQEDIRDTYQRLGPYYFLWKRQFRFGSASGPKAKPLPDMWFEFNSFHRL